ncbi:PPOX class F420-dependent oxidoreductase [Mycobacterium sp. 134]|uniref:PPOX class F420-dependent oxidoreductase n=1 Tax=Mycobacterium sp. 134 TaxID=3400425 RepID=UPI003AAF31D7
MPTIPESHRDLAETPLVASLSTVGADGTPQVTAIWFVAEGHTVQISLLQTRQKYRNVAARPQATLFVIDPKNPFRTLEIRGTVKIDEDSDLALFERVFRHYGQDPATSGAPTEGRVVVTLSPTHVVAQG